mmetsp:Transcript_32371/g.96831  ORF Transcript_32371/g.96831 Transcript_32371/m.96831 type:complete len:570 (+) Transcript_32371:415-2124(+)
MRRLERLDSCASKSRQPAHARRSSGASCCGVRAAERSDPGPWYRKEPPAASACASSVAEGACRDPSRAGHSAAWARASLSSTSEAKTSPRRPPSTPVGSRTSSWTSTAQRTAPRGASGAPRARRRRSIETERSRHTPPPPHSSANTPSNSRGRGERHGSTMTIVGGRATAAVPPCGSDSVSREPAGVSSMGTSGSSSGASSASALETASRSASTRGGVAWKAAAPRPALATSRALRRNLSRGPAAGSGGSGGSGGAAGCISSATAAGRRSDFDLLSAAMRCRRLASLIASMAADKAAGDNSARETRTGGSPSPACAIVAMPYARPWVVVVSCTTRAPAGSPASSSRSEPVSTSSDLHGTQPRSASSSASCADFHTGVWAGCAQRCSRLCESCERSTAKRDRGSHARRQTANQWSRAAQDVATESHRPHSSGRSAPAASASASAASRAVAASPSLSAPSTRRSKPASPSRASSAPSSTAATSPSPGASPAAAASASTSASALPASRPASPLASSPSDSFGALGFHTPPPWPRPRAIAMSARPSESPASRAAREWPARAREEDEWTSARST